MFVQIGNRAFNPDNVTEVYLEINDKPVTRVLFNVFDHENETQAYMQFTGDDRRKFLAWWENKAEVYVA